LIPINGFEQERFHNDINFGRTIYSSARPPTVKHPSRKYQQLAE
jgi:hypothetical protein